MICEADADVMMAEIGPCSGALVGGLCGKVTVLVVKDVLELHLETCFILP